MAKRKWAKGQTMTCTEKQRLSSKTQQTTEGEFTCYGKVCCSCSTSLNRRVTIATNPVIRHEWRKTKLWLLGLGLCSLTPRSTTFQLYSRSQFYWWRKPEYSAKTTDLLQVTDNLSHNVVPSTPRQTRIRTHNVCGDRHRLNR
jgi:hypothetical protein